MRKIYILVISILILVVGTYSYAWYIDKSNVGYIVSTNVNLNIKGWYAYYSNDNNTISIKQDWTELSNESNNSISISYDNVLSFAFVVTNTSDEQINFNMRLSDFSTYIFDSVNASSTLTDEDKSNIIKYNSKFFLSIGNVKYKEVASNFTPSFSDREGFNDITLRSDNTYTFEDQNSLLWKYSYNNLLFNQSVSIDKNKSIVLNITLRNEQSNTSLQVDYPYWLKSYGYTYLSNKGSTLNKEQIEAYLDKYYDEEKKTLYQDSEGTGSILNDTTLCIDYFEFIADL